MYLGFEEDYIKQVWSKTMLISDFAAELNIGLQKARRLLAYTGCIESYVLNQVSDEEFKEYYLSSNYREAAKHFKVTSPFILARVDKLKISKVPKRNLNKPKSVKFQLAFTEEDIRNHTVEELIKISGHANATVYRYLYRYGILEVPEIDREKFLKTFYDAGAKAALIEQNVPMYASLPLYQKYAIPWQFKRNPQIIWDYFNEGHSISECMRHFNVVQKTIYAALKWFGWTPRKDFPSRFEIEQDLLRVYKVAGFFSNEVYSKLGRYCWQQVYANFGSIESICRKFDFIRAKSYRSNQDLFFKLFNSYSGFDVEFEKKFDWLRYKSFMRLDAFYPKFNVAVEFDDPSHFLLNYRNRSYEEFKIMKERDSLKDKLCAEHGIKVIRVPYWRPWSDLEFDRLISEILKYSR